MQQSTSQQQQQHKKYEKQRKLEKHERSAGVDLSSGTGALLLTPALTTTSSSTGSAAAATTTTTTTGENNQVLGRGSEQRQSGEWQALNVHEEESEQLIGSRTSELLRNNNQPPRPPERSISLNSLTNKLAVLAHSSPPAPRVHDHHLHFRHHSPHFESKGLARNQRASNNNNKRCKGKFLVRHKTSTQEVELLNESEGQRLIERSSSRDCSSESQEIESKQRAINSDNNNNHNKSSSQIECLICEQQDNSNSTLKCKQSRMSSKAYTGKLIAAYFVAELIGTFILVLIGDGAIGAYVLTRRQVDVFAVCFAFGVGAMIATFVSGKISGAHLNPAASLAMALDGQLKWSLLPVYVCAQYAGGFLGALALYLNYAEAIESLDGGQRSAFGETNSTGGIFATYPADYLSIWGSLMDQILGTAVLLFSLSAVGDRNNLALDQKHQPLIVAFVIGLVCVAFSPNCGAIFNPARDLSPRLITAIFGYGPQVWQPLDGSYWLVAGVVGPHIGAIIGLFAYKYLIKSALRIAEDSRQEFELTSPEVAECCSKQRNCHPNSDQLMSGLHFRSTSDHQPAAAAGNLEYGSGMGH